MARLSVMTNVAANNAQANLYSTSIGLRNALTRVSWGAFIDDALDGAASSGAPGFGSSERVNGTGEGSTTATLTRFSVLTQSGLAALADACDQKESAAVSARR